MDIANHIAWGFTLSEAIGSPPELSIAVGILSATPDIIGAVGGSYKGNWKWYNWAHKFNWLWFIPPYLLHVLMDIPAHIKERKYWWHFNIFSWVLLIGVLLWL